MQISFGENFEFTQVDDIESNRRRVTHAKLKIFFLLTSPPPVLDICIVV